MHKSIARQIHDIATYKDEIACVSNIKCIKLISGDRESTWVFLDNSTLTLDDYGSCKVDGKYMS